MVTADCHLHFCSLPTKSSARIADMACRQGDTIKNTRTNSDEKSHCSPLSIADTPPPPTLCSWEDFFRLYFVITEPLCHFYYILLSFELILCHFIRLGLPKIAKPRNLLISWPPVSQHELLYAHLNADMLLSRYRSLKQFPLFRTEQHIEHTMVFSKMLCYRCPHV